MRVCLIVRQFPAVSETFVVDQAVGLLRRGHEVVIVPERPIVPDPVSGGLGQIGLMDRVIREPSISERRAARARDLAILARGLVASKGGIARVSREIGIRDMRRTAKTMFWAMRLVEAGSVDVIHSHFGPSALFAVAARRAGLVRAPIVATVHGTDVTRLPRKRGPDMYRSAFREVESLTVGSAFIADVAVKLGAAPKKLHRLPQGVDTRAFVRTRRDGREDRSFTLVTVARLVEVKGVDYGLRAVSIASAHVPKLRYLIVGDGPERSRLERLADELGICDRVSFLGAQDRSGVVEAFDRSDAFLLSGVLTTDGSVEGQGLAVLEAMATGLPAIVSDVGGLGEGVRDGETGFLVGERDVEGLAGHIVDLASHSAGRRRMGDAASSYVRERFSLDAHLDSLERLYRSVLADHAGRPRRDGEDARAS
jgi:colanic acid/amylovoran biosynthesis glycosyltransferase